MLTTTQHVHTFTGIHLHLQEYILILKQLFTDHRWIDINMGVFLKEMYSNCCKNHCCSQKIPEGTSSAMFDVRTIAKCCEFKQCTSVRFDVM